VPVMFELGARPHPPRPVYRAYLAQSQVFVGIYWQSYGHVAPGEQMSGLEDEYEMSAGLSRLIYVKSPAPDREPRLTQLLAGSPPGRRRTAGRSAACRAPARRRPLDPGSPGERVAARLRATRRARQCGPGHVALPHEGCGIPGRSGVGRINRQQARRGVRTALTRTPGVKAGSRSRGHSPLPGAPGADARPRAHAGG
jgi:hypothetical protein